jgi:hypothetical protein
MLRQDNAYRQQQQQLNGIQNQLGSINQQLQPPPPSSWSNPQGRTFSNPYGP